jgi:hypothetical protein
LELGRADCGHVRLWRSQLDCASPHDIAGHEGPQRTR